MIKLGIVKIKQGSSKKKSKTNENTNFNEPGALGTLDNGIKLRVPPLLLSGCVNDFVISFCKKVISRYFFCI